MSDVKKHKDRIPFESLDADDAVSSWNLPSMGTTKRVVRSKSREEKKHSNEKIETVSRPKKMKPLTAEDLERITEEARREGFQQGLQEGTEKGIREGTKVGEKTGEQRAYSEAKKDIDALQNRLRNIANSLFDPMQNQSMAVENTVVDMALNIARAIIQTEVSSKPALLVDIVKRCIDVLPSAKGSVRVYLNESDSKLLENLRSPSAEKWQIIVDDSLATGGCRVETDQSDVDYSVESRLAAYLGRVDLLKDKSLPKDQAPVPEYAADINNELEHEPDVDADAASDN